MHAMKLIGPSQGLSGAGGASALLYPTPRVDSVVDLGERKIDIGDRTDIGAAICRLQAFVGAGERLRLRFLDGGTWIGNVTLSREDDDLAFKVDGTIFGGSGDDRGVSLSFVCEPDGPIGLPIIVRDCDGSVIGFYTDADEDNPEPDAETVKAAFFASGASFTAATAPPIKPESHLGYAAESAKVGVALKAAAAKAEAAWKPALGREQGKAGGNNGDAWFRYQGKRLVSMAPGEKVEGAGEPVWPRPMPKPEKRASEPKVKAAKSAPDAPKAPEKRAVHKRVGKGAPVMALTKVV